MDQSPVAKDMCGFAAMNHRAGSGLSDRPFLWIMVATTAWSGIHYGWRGWTKLKTVRLNRKVR
jgi:hypothetical protein